MFVLKTSHCQTWFSVYITVIYFPKMLGSNGSIMCYPDALLALCLECVHHALTNGIHLLYCYKLATDLTGNPSATCQ